VPGRKGKSRSALAAPLVARGPSWPEILVTVIALAAGAALYLYAHKDEGALEESKARGSAIVEALERHRIEHGDYPPALDSLVPSYLPAIEAPSWGLGRWKYERYTRTAPAGGTAPASANSYFMLSVAQSESGYPLLYYDFTGRRWVLNN
jgi:hypothetical protein